MREKQEKEEKEKKMREEQERRKLEQLQKEKDLMEQEKLKQQIEKQKIKEEKKIEEEENNEINEIKIGEIDDDDIDELEEGIDSSQTKSHIKPEITKPEDIKKSKLKSENNTSKITNNNKFNNKSINKSKNISPKKTAQIKESMNKINKLPKGDKTPEKDLSQVKPEKNREESEFGKKFKNSEIISKLSQEITNQILELIYSIDDFEEKISENDDINIYPSITQFDTEEKGLKEKIPEYESKILEKEKTSEDDRIRIYFSEEEANEKNQENEKISELLTEIMNLSNETHMDLLQKKLEKDNLKNLPTKELEDLTEAEDIENKLFEKADFYPESNPIISNLENLQTFIYKYQDAAEEKPSIMVNAYKYFNHWRYDFNDGNSFYRVSMFALIEHCILQNDSMFLSLILSEICSDDFIEYYKNAKIEYEKPFLILSAIWLSIQNDGEEKAHEYLLKGYNLKNGCLDMLLIMYLKKVLTNYAEEINKLLEEKKKSGENLELIDKAVINIEQIENLYLDPPNINLFYLISSLFNINIKLYLLGGNYLDPINSLKDIKCIETSPTFIFGYFFSGYHILYTPGFEEDNEVFQNLVLKDNPQLCRLAKTLKEKKKCDICFQETDHLCFIKKRFIVCIPCLLSHIKEKIKIRSGYFFEEKCLGQEYYSRPIHLQDDFYIDDFEFIEIFQEYNIINKIFENNKSNKCAQCGKIKSEDVKLKALECKCNYCLDCLEEIILEVTNNYAYLIPCEVEILKKKFKCKCDKIYSYNDLEKLFNPTEEQKAEAKKRLSGYIERYCLICLKDLIKDDDMKNIKIKKEDEDDKEHFICNKCYCKYFRKVDSDSDDEENITKEEMTKGENEEDRDKEEVKVIKEENKIKCSICKKWHRYNGNVDGCGCFIF